MTYAIKAWTQNRLRKCLQAIPESDREALRDKIERLATNPQSAPPLEIKKLTGDIWRVKVPPYRVIYKIDDAALTVWIGWVGRRREGTYVDPEGLFPGD